MVVVVVVVVVAVVVVIVGPQNAIISSIPGFQMASVALELFGAF